MKWEGLPCQLRFRNRLRNSSKCKPTTERRGFNHLSANKLFASPLTGDCCRVIFAEVRKRLQSFLMDQSLGSEIHVESSFALVSAHARSFRSGNGQGRT